MSVALENIFDEPLPSSPSPTRRIASATVNDNTDDEDDEIFPPSKRRKQALFLDDPDEVGYSPRASSSKGPTAAAAAPEGVDSLFEDLDELEKETAPSKPFDLEAARREASARVAKEPPSSQFTRYAVQSSSPPREGLSEQKSTGRVPGAKGKDGEKEKRPIAKMDETRLLGKDGLPALVQLCKDFKPKGKGHEIQDLNRLFSVYQFWSHKMYPKTQFSDTVDRIEKLCHQKRLQVALAVYRDQVNGTINGFKLEDNDDQGMQSDGSDEGGNEAVRRGRNTPPSSQAASSSRASSAAPDPPLSRPPSSASNNDDNDFDMGDDFDLDAMLAQEEEMINARATTSSASNRPPTLNANQVKSKKSGGGGPGGVGFSITEDDEALFEELIGDDPSMFDDDPLPCTSANGNGATSSESRPPDPAVLSSSAQPRVSSEPEDEWAIFEEIEAEQLADARRAAESTSAQLGQTSGSVGESQTQLQALETTSMDAPGSVTVPLASSAATTRVESGQLSTESAKTGYGDEDWDDMYVDD